MTEKPHGTFGPQPEKGIYIEREPKGDPDIILVANCQDLDLIYRVADILSVQGYTARLLCVYNINNYVQQKSDYKKKIFHPSSPVLSVNGCLKKIMDDLTENTDIQSQDRVKVAQVARNLIIEQKEN